MKFIRLTSVFLCCALLSPFLILPASAVDDDNYYSVPPVAASEPSLAIDWPVNPVSGEYSSILGAINQSLGGISSQISDVLQNQVAIAQILSGISGILTGNGSILGRIESSVGILSVISDKVATESTLFAISGKVATETTLSRFDSYFRNVFYSGGQGSISSASGHFFYPVYNASLQEYRYLSWGDFMQVFFDAVSRDGSIGNGAISLYTYVKNLSETLASDDDRQLAENYKDNRQQAEQDFLSGQSGKTSLGKDDFGSLSSVGGTFKDTISLNGQSSIGDLTSGLSDADTAGQGWFSQATKDSLDAVSGSGSAESTVSTFSDDGLYSVDVDPYHMEGFEQNYAWLWGDDDG